MTEKKTNSDQRPAEIAHQQLLQSGSAWNGDRKSTRLNSSHSP